MIITDFQLDAIVNGSETFESKEELQLFLNDYTPKEQEALVLSIVGGLSQEEQKFADLFPYRYKWTKGPGNPYNGTNVDWIHPHGKLTDEVLMSNWSNPSTFISVSFDTTTRYLVLDIDTNSRYYGRASRVKIEEALEAVGINLVSWYESSGSEGLHGYIVFPCDVSTFGASCIINKCLREADFQISDGDLEVYPNMKTFNAGYKTIRLPLQKGFGCTLDIFLNDWLDGEEANDASLFISNEEEARKWVKTQKLVCIREDRGDGSASNWHRSLKEVIKEGWTGYSQTNTILGRIAQYHRVFDDKAVDVPTMTQLMVETATRCPGYSKFCQHKHKIEQRCRDWANAAWRRYKPYGSVDSSKKRDRSKPIELNKKNNASIENQNKIVQAVQDLIDSKESITISSVSRSAGLSRKTVTKYKSLLDSNVAGAATFLHSGAMGNRSIEQIEAEESFEPEVPKDSTTATFLHSDSMGSNLDSISTIKPIVVAQKDSIIESQLKDEQRCKDLLETLNNRFSDSNIQSLIDELTN